MTGRSGVTWQGPKPGGSYSRRRLNDAKDTLIDAAADILAEEVETAAENTQDYLEAATTKTGRARAQRGGFPGRHDTGNMVGSLSYDERGEVNTKAKTVWFRWGWWGRNFEEYFRAQDTGEGDMRGPAAQALPNAFLRAEARVRYRLKVLVKYGVVK